MKALVFSWFYPPIIGGAEILAERTVSLLLQEGFDVTLVRLDHSKGIDIFGDVTLIVTNYICSDENTTPIDDFNGWLESQEQHNYNLIYTHNILLPLNLRISKALISFAQRTATPIIEHAHTIPRPSELFDHFTELESKHLITVSGFLQNCFKSIAPNTWLVEEQKAHVVHNPVDLAVFYPNTESRIRTRKALGIDDYQQMVLFPSRVFDINGTLSEAKNAPLALESFAVVSQQLPNSVLVLIAPPGFLNETEQQKSLQILKEKAVELGVEDRLMVLSKSLDPNGMAEFYNAADACLIPSKESFCLCAAESLACQTPFVGLNYGGPVELYPNGDTAALVNMDENKAQNLAETMIRILTNPKATKSLTKRAQEHLRYIADLSVWKKNVKSVVRQALGEE